MQNQNYKKTKTKSWKHIRKDKRQFIRNGKAKSHFWDYDPSFGWERCEFWEPINYDKRNTLFMQDDLDPEHLQSA